MATEVEVSLNKSDNLGLSEKHPIEVRSAVPNILPIGSVGI
jgi:hypothetical protein